ncbi:hypothetical protein QYF61_014597 [Mycteria americana]|uniref:Uncharacterized protein n=1 Tax=Mycteria americana TaxID=33587 RepID=A0AAN7MYX7_MYCAM|nr:hypothetical protein QYF61_014597 [Mycteria americana]
MPRPWASLALAESSAEHRRRQPLRLAQPQPSQGTRDLLPLLLPLGQALPAAGWGWGRGALPGDPLAGVPVRDDSVQLFQIARSQPAVPRARTRQLALRRSDAVHQDGGARQSRCSGQDSAAPGAPSTPAGCLGRKPPPANYARSTALLQPLFYGVGVSGLPAEQLELEARSIADTHYNITQCQHEPELGTHLAEKLLKEKGYSEWDPLPSLPRGRPARVLVLAPLRAARPVAMLHDPCHEEVFCNVQSKPPLAQLEAISSHPITSYLGEETNPHLSTPSFQVVVESNKVSPQPPFLQTKQPQFPQLLLIRLLLQTLHQLCCPSLDMLQHLNVSLVVRGPKLNTVFEVRPHQCRVQGDDHFPSPAGHATSDTSQDAIGFLGHLGTLLAHIQPAVNQHFQVLFLQAAFQPLFPKPVALHGVVDPALGFVEPHTTGLGPSIQPVQVPLQSLPTLKQINTPTQLGVICKLTESALDPLVRIIDKDIKQNWPQN